MTATAQSNTFSNCSSDPDVISLYSEKEVSEMKAKIQQLEKSLQCANAKVKVLQQQPSTALSSALTASIKNLMEENASLKSEVSELKQTVQFYKDLQMTTPQAFVPTVTDNSTQTESAADSSSVWSVDGNVTAASVAEMVQQTATQAAFSAQFPGYIFDDASQMYYNHETCYYYDPKSGLFFNVATQRYYFFDSQTQEYRVWLTAEEEQQIQQQKQNYKKSFQEKHYRKLAHKYNFPTDGSTDPHAFEVLMDLCEQVDQLSLKPSKPRKRKRDEKKRRSKDRRRSSSATKRRSQRNVAETNDSLDSYIDQLYDDSADEIEVLFDGASASARFPPSIRVVVRASDCLKPGSLCCVINHVQPITIGRSPDCDIILLSENVSKTHAKVAYDSTLGCYTIEDLNSRNGTFVNGQRIEAITEVGHAFLISISGTELLFHMHPGSNTCLGCEPAFQIAPETKTAVASSGDRERDRLKELKSLKKKFGLEHAAFERSSAKLPSAYTDRATVRRVTKGSDNPYKKKINETAASVHKPIAATNKGFKMLSKLGWKEGEALGSSIKGIVEPINPSLQMGRSGLGASSSSGLSALDPDSAVIAKRREITTITKLRFEKITNPAVEAVRSRLSQDY